MAEKSRVRDLVVKMVEDAELAKAVIKDPRRYQKEYALSESAVRALGAIKLDDLAIGSVSNPQSFAQGAIATGNLGSLAVEAGGCYYGG